MPETVALLRLAVVKSRMVLAVSVATLVIGLICFAVMQSGLVTAAQAPNGEDASLALVALCFSLVPCAFATLLLFDYGIESDLNHPASGCNHWLLRMPIKAWKIAAVPIVLKSLWVSALWVVLVIAVQVTGSVALPIMAPCLALSGSAILLLVIGWRPFRHGWQRLVALAVAVPMIYCVLAAAGHSPFLDRVEWRTSAVVASRCVSIVFFGGTIWATIRSVQLARVATDGLIPEIGRRVGVDSLRAPRRREFRGPWTALMLKDWLKNRRRIAMVLIAGAVPAIVILSCLIPFNAVSAVFAIVGFSYLGGIAATQTGGPSDNPSELPPLFAAAPIRTSTLSWAKMVSTLSIIAMVYGGVLFVLAGWTCWAENRATWFEWAEGVTASIGLGGDPFWTGLRVSAAIVIGWSVFFLCRIAAYCWIGMTGRAWVGVLMAFVAGGTFLVPLGIAIGWFLRQSDWESTRESAISYLSWLPTLFAMVLSIKCIATLVVGWNAYRRQIVRINELSCVVGLWLGLVLTVSTILAGLIPDPRFTWLWCVTVTAACIPLARVLLGPLALSWNRHR